MRKLVLIALAGTALSLAVPQLASATPLSPASGVTTAADSVSSTEKVWHRRGHPHRNCRHRHHGRCW